MKKIAGLFLLVIVAVVAIPVVKYKTLSPCEMLKTEIVERSRAQARAATDRGREEVSELGEDAVRFVEGIGSAVENAVAGVSAGITEGGSTTCHCARASANWSSGSSRKMETNRLRRLVALADGTRKGIGILTSITAFATLWNWAWLAGPVAVRGGWWAGLGVAAILVMAVPALVLVCLYWALNQIRAIPANTRDALSDGRDRARQLRPASDLPNDSRRRSVRLLKAVWEIWRLVMESKEALLGYAAMVRLANPVSLVVVTAALLASMGMITAAAFTLAVTLVTGQFGW